MIRYITVVAFLVLYLIFSMPVYFIYHLIRRFNKEKGDYLAFHAVQNAFGVILKISGTSITVIGKENIPEDAALFIGNHRSLFDIHITNIHFPRITGYVAKDGLLKAPILRGRMKDIYCLFLNRSDPREGMKMILTAIEYIKSGISMCVFPEGTRSEGSETELLEFKEGAFKIANKSKCAIVPISISHTRDIFERQFPKIRKAHIVIEYGTPIYMDELDAETKRHMGAYCRNIIIETLEKNEKLYYTTQGGNETCKM